MNYFDNKNEAGFGPNSDPGKYMKLFPKSRFAITSQFEKVFISN